MNARDETRRAEKMERLLASLLQGLERDPGFEIEAFLSDHPEESELLRERLSRLERFGLLETGSLSSAEFSGADTADPDPRISLDPAPRGANEIFSAPLLSRLASHSSRQSRYEYRGLLGRGGMGTVLEVRDRIIGRSLAKKVINDGEEGGLPGHLVGPGTVARFIEEAQVTGQLDHPGIVPVHELGLDADGRIYFTMKLVTGRTLAEVFELAPGSGWSRTRSLGIVLKVCETVAYAHERGVVHRDLKPTNVMVGRFGEVYVMDWGLARVMALEETGTAERELPVRGESGRDSSRASGATRAGDVLGTPVYMAPEQARGDVLRVGPRSDVYSVGAILYQLFTGRPPYVLDGESLAPAEVLERVLSGPPEPIDEVVRRLPPELVAVCQKAMARDPEERYSTMRCLADDLEAFLDGRGVSAYGSNAIGDLKRWARRNRPAVARLAAALVVVLLAGSIGLRFGVHATRAKNESVAAADAAARARAVAEEKVDRILGLAAAQRIEDLVARADELWPVDPKLKGSYELWLADARELVRSLEGHEAQLMELQARALPWTPEQKEEDHRNHPRSWEIERARWVVDNSPTVLEKLRTEALQSPGEVDPIVAALEKTIDEAWASIDMLEPIVRQRWNWRFASPDDQWWHDRLLQLTRDMRGLLDEKQGLIAGISQARGWGVQRRLNAARSLQDRSIRDPRAQLSWEEAIASIQNAAQCPAYAGLSIRPQVGLLPLGRDPASGLWEFAHLLTGEPPERDSEGRLQMTEESCVVLVLVPGGAFVMGAQSEDPARPNFDAAAREFDGPPHQFDLDPFFISKYEMSQGQWARFAGTNPSYQSPNAPTWRRIEGTDLLHPVEAVNWKDCVKTLGRMGLALPTEAQWEYAARAGTNSVWWTGTDRNSLLGAVNLADRSGFVNGQSATWPSIDDWPELRDGYLGHAPVDSMRPNPYGLHHVHGNVFEWCSTPYADYSESPRAGDGERDGDESMRMMRGGSFGSTAGGARVAHRAPTPPDSDSNAVGLRPAKALSR